MEARRLVNADGTPWRGGERAYDAATGRLAQTGLEQMAAAMWPTPMAGTPARNGNSEAGNNDSSRRTMELAEALWQTPASDSFRSRGGDRKDEMGLDQQARSDLWATPASRDHKGENGPDHLKNGTGRLHMDQLPNQVAHAFRSPLPARQTPQHGSPSSEWRPISRRLFRSAMSNVPAITRRRWLRKGSWRKRRLNPLFVEWLMGWPSGHALCASSETAFILWKRRSRGALSAMPLASAPWIWEPLKEEAETQLDMFG